jgi:tetratricopeptide (TPR) repeat protein
VQGDTGRPSLGDYDGARLSYQKAEGLLAPLIERKPNDPNVIIRWLEVESGLAKLLCAHFERQQGLDKYTAILPLARRLARLLPADPNAVRQEGAVEGNISQVLQPTDLTGGREHARRQIVLLTAAVDRFPQDRDLKQELGVALAASATSLKDSGDFIGAADHYERSIRIREEYLQADPNNGTVQRNLLVVYGNYGSLLGIPWSANLGRFAEARVYCEKSVALARKLSAAEPQDQSARLDLAMSLAYLGMVEPDAEHVAESMKNLEEALALIQPMRKANPNSPGLANQVALMHQYAGYRSAQMGRTAEAGQHFREGMTELEPIIAANPYQQAAYPLALANEEGLAEICAAQGDRAGAMEHARHAVAGAEHYFAVSNKRESSVGHLAKAYLALALVDRAHGDWDGAAEAAARARSLFGALSNPGVISVQRPALEQLQTLTRELASHAAH